MRTLKLFKVASVLFVFVLTTLSSASAPEENAKACFLDTDECYELPFSESFRQAYNQIGDQRGFVRDFFTNDSFYWNRYANLTYYNPANERIIEEMRKAFPEKPPVILKSGMLLTCKNAQMLDHMFAAGKQDSARRSLNAAFERFKQGLLKFNADLHDKDKDTPKEIIGRRLIEPVERYVHEAFEYCQEKGWDTHPYRLDRVRKIT